MKNNNIVVHINSKQNIKKWIYGRVDIDSAALNNAIDIE